MKPLNAMHTRQRCAQSLFKKYNQEHLLKFYDKLSKVVKVEPLGTIMPVDPSKTKWIELEKVDPMTGAPVRCVIAALCSGRPGTDDMSNH